MSGAIAECVAKGAALLDEKVPGWRERIDLDMLDTVSPYGCVLGQLFEENDSLFGFRAGYWPGLRALGIPESPVTEPAAFGFAAETSAIRDYRALDDEWKRVITERRTAVPA